MENGGNICYGLYRKPLLFLMPDEKQSSNLTNLPSWAIKLLDLPWIEIAGALLKYGRKVVREMANEGVYETLYYESTLEIHNSKGTRATFSKRKKIR
jgi:hypothetical protein